MREMLEALYKEVKAPQLHKENCRLQMAHDWGLVLLPALLEGSPHPGGAGKALSGWAQH